MQKKKKEKKKQDHELVKIVEDINKGKELPFSYSTDSILYINSCVYVRQKDEELRKQIHFEVLEAPYSFT